MTYHKISIGKLSHAQLLKLMRGHRIRVKHGSGHEIHVSEEQHKKIMCAHRRGAGTTIQFDPYQMDMHKGHHGHGEGHAHHAHHAHHGGSMLDYVKPVVKTLGPVAIDAGSNALKGLIDGWGARGRRKSRTGHGEGTIHHKRKSNTGGALNPAGYGEGKGGRRKRGKGIRSHIDHDMLF